MNALARPLRRIVVMSLVLVGGAASVAYATGNLQLGTQTLTACANDSNGLLRLVGSPSDCRQHETPATWNAEGPPGPQGPQGDQGPKGDPGTVGSIDQLNGTPCTRQGRNGTLSIGSDSNGFTLTLACLTLDNFEPNDTRATESVIAPTNLAATIYPAGDEDWYAVPHASLMSISFSPASGADATLEVYRDGALVQTTHGGFVPTPPGEVHDWELHVTGTGTFYYSLVIMPGFFFPPPGP